MNSSISECLFAFAISLYCCYILLFLSTSRFIICRKSFHHIDFRFNFDPVIIDKADFINPTEESFPGIHQS